MNENQDINQIIDNIIKSISTIKSENEKLKNTQISNTELTSMEMTIQKKDSEIQNLTQQLETLKRENETLKKEKNEYLARINQLATAVGKTPAPTSFEKPTTSAPIEPPTETTQNISVGMPQKKEPATTMNQRVDTSFSAPPPPSQTPPPPQPIQTPPPPQPIQTPPPQSSSPAPQKENTSKASSIDDIFGDDIDDPFENDGGMNDDDFFKSIQDK